MMKTLPYLDRDQVATESVTLKLISVCFTFLFLVFLVFFL